MSNRVGILSNNSVSVIMTILRIWNDDKGVVLIHGETPVNALLDIIIENDIKECYCDSSIIEHLIKEVSNVNWICLLEEKSKYINTKGLDIYLHPMSDDIALVLYSSGTTGRAKGIMLSHRAINENANAIINYMSVRDDDVFAIIKNLEHSSTIIGEVIVAIKCGCPIVLVDNHLSISMILENLYRSKATITCMNPTILALFMRMAPSLLSRKSRYLRKIYISGAILNKELMINAKKKLRHCNLFNVYGMTECGPRISSQELSTHTNNNSVGKPIVGVRLRILDENGNVIKKSNTIGSIEVNTPYRAQGYVNGHTLCSDNYGWIKTGDNGYFDKNGDLYIVGRIDNMLNVYGHNVYPESIEEVIQKINGVEACLVTGIRNEILGCTLCCYYIGKLVTNQQIYEHCKQYLHTYEIPRKYVCVDSLQYSNGKIVRKQFDNISVIEK